MPTNCHVKLNVTSNEERKQVQLIMSLQVSQISDLSADCISALDSVAFSSIIFFLENQGNVTQL